MDLAKSYGTLVIDTSGSMGDQSYVEGVSTGQSILKVVCGAASAFISQLGETDAIALVSFSDDAQIKMPLTLMTQENKDLLVHILSTLTPDGCTNTWAGLELGLNSMLSSYRAKSQSGVKFKQWLFTDGQHNVNPKNLAGFQRSLLDYKETSDGFLPEIDVFGFGNNLNIKVLEFEIARTTGGLFAYISTPDMVATTFVNSAAHWMCRGPKMILDEVNEHWRLELVVTLRAIYNDGNMGDFPAALSKVREMSLGMRAQGASQGFIDDVEGEVALSVSTPQAFNKWGHSFLLFMASAHSNKLCANFKNPGLQIYATEEFETNKAKVAASFVQITQRMDAEAAQNEARRALVAQQYGQAYVPQVQVSSASLYNSAGGCFSGKCQVLMFDGTQKRVSTLNIGDKIFSGQGKGAKITAIAITRITPTAPAVIFVDGLIITGYHPVQINGDWMFPMDEPPGTISKGTAASCGLDYVYSFAIEGTQGKTHSMIVNGIIVATLGHGVMDDPALRHDLFGSQHVVDCIKEMNSAGQTIINENGWIWLNDATGRVIDLIFDYDAADKIIESISMSKEITA